MCEELKNLDFPGTGVGVVYFLKDIIGFKTLPANDVGLLCARLPSSYRISFPAILNYCKAFGWIAESEGVSLSPALLKQLERPDHLNEFLVQDSLGILFASEILQPSMFSFDVLHNHLRFHDEQLPLAYATIRNVLASQGFLEVERTPNHTVFFVCPIFEDFVSTYKKRAERKLSIERLQKKLEENAAAGEKAEAFVLQYEQQRLPPHQKHLVKIISHIDASAGYDIVSFEEDSSQSFDRFIEVKAISRDTGFFWSKNECNVAKLKGAQYYLYLVDLGQIEVDEYVPLIIQDPAKKVMQSTEWLIETETFHIRKI